MTTIYLVSVVDMEPYSDYAGGPAKAFHTKEEAERFIKDHPDVYDAGYFTFDEDTETQIECHEDTEHAHYEDGWAYSGYIQEIELIEHGQKVDCQQTKSTNIT
jgi:hypothetical protein